MNGVPGNIRLDQARCLIGYKVKNFCKQNNINIISAPANDHRVIGLVERLIQTIKRRLSFMKLDNRNNTFTIKEAIKSIVYQLRICKQKTTNVTLFQAHFEEQQTRHLATYVKSQNLSYENILNHYFDADTVPVEDYLDDNGWDEWRMRGVTSSLRKQLPRHRWMRAADSIVIRISLFPVSSFTRNSQLLFPVWKPLLNLG